MGRRPKIQFSNGDIPMAKGPMKRCSTREMQTNTWVRYYLTPVRIAIVKGVQITSVGKAVEEKDLAAAAAKSLHLCPTLCDPIDGSPPGSPVPGILQARTLEWVAISFSNAWKWKVKVKSLSRIRLFATPWTAAHQAPLSVGFSRQEYWSGVPLPSPSISISTSIFGWPSSCSKPSHH